jgi:hypothetical protein
LQNFGIRLQISQSAPSILLVLSYFNEQFGEQQMFLFTTNSVLSGMPSNKDVVLISSKLNIPAQLESLQSNRSGFAGGLAVMRYNMLEPYLERVILWTALTASSKDGNLLPGIIRLARTDSAHVQSTKLSTWAK